MGPWIGGDPSISTNIGPKSYALRLPGNSRNLEIIPASQVPPGSRYIHYIRYAPATVAEQADPWVIAYDSSTRSTVAGTKLVYQKKSVVDASLASSSRTYSYFAVILRQADPTTNGKYVLGFDWANNAYTDQIWGCPIAGSGDSNILELYYATSGLNVQFPSDCVRYQDSGSPDYSFAELVAPT